MIEGFYQLRAAFESIGFDPPTVEKRSVDDGDFDDTEEDHIYEERRRLFTT